MKRISILSDVLGPIMRGPSSSHTAASYAIGAFARSALHAPVRQARITFREGSSYAVCFRRQGSDLGFAAGLLGWEMTDPRFRRALELAPGEGLDIQFEVGPIPEDDHPNAVRLNLAGEAGRKMELLARSIGGGMFEVTALNGAQASHRGPEPLRKVGNPPFASASAMQTWMGRTRMGAGEAGLCYEAELLGLDAAVVRGEMLRRYTVMRSAVLEGLEPTGDPMILLGRSASSIYLAEGTGRVAVGGLHTRAAARAMAAMHTNCSMGVVCAAPTAGSAGVLPGVVVTLAEECGATDDDIVRCLFAAGLIGVFIAERATFAAEIAGCQVEIGAATAMAAAAVVEFAHGSALQACDAAAISLQNTMGSVCDLVQGVVEIPCHTRNAVGASSAFVCADLILGGYHNPIPLDETIDAVLSVGKMMPEELRVTSKGGIAVTPSALAMKARL
jgi:L-serine dehydratase